MAKRYFAEHGMTYDDRDVASDTQALREMVNVSGQYGVPVIRVGEKLMIGWNPQRFENLLRD